MGSPVFNTQLGILFWTVAGALHGATRWADPRTQLEQQELVTGLADTEPHEWHIITCEYPPSVGGVSDYSFTLASGLGATGTVHVWCPAGTSAAPEVEHVTVHDAPGSFSLRISIGWARYSTYSGRDTCSFSACRRDSAIAR